MSICKFCTAEITWIKEGDKSVPLNIDGTKHFCKKSPAPKGTNIGTVEKYEANNVHIDGKTFFIPGTDIKAAMENNPVGKVVSYTIHPKQKGTMQGMATPSQAEIDKYNKEHGAEPKKPIPTPAAQQPLSNPPAKESGFKTAKEILKENLDAKVAERTNTPPSAGIPPTGVAQSAAIAHEITKNVQQTGSAPIQHTDPLKDTAPLELPEKQPITGFGGGMSRPLPTLDELVEMVYSYETYWKAKTFIDLIVQHRIEKQVEFKNRLECINSAITFASMNSKTKPTSEQVYDVATDIYTHITGQMNEGKCTPPTSP